MVLFKNSLSLVGNEDLPSVLQEVVVSDYDEVQEALHLISKTFNSQKQKAQRATVSWSNDVKGDVTELDFLRKRVATLEKELRDEKRQSLAEKEELQLQIKRMAGVLAHERADRKVTEQRLRSELRAAILEHERILKRQQQRFEEVALLRDERQRIQLQRDDLQRSLKRAVDDLMQERADRKLSEQRMRAELKALAQENEWNRKQQQLLKQDKESKI